MRKLQTWWRARRRTMSAQELIRRYGKGERDFSGISLKDSPNLVAADLRQSDLSSSDLSGANLVKVRLDGASLRAADLRNAQLYEATLRQADLRQADLTDANLLLAELQGADLTGAQVSDASLAAAYSLEGARLPDGTPYDREAQARLHEASLRQARASLEAHPRDEPP